MARIEVSVGESEHKEAPAKGVSESSGESCSEMPDEANHGQSRASKEEFLEFLQEPLEELTKLDQVVAPVEIERPVLVRRNNYVETSLDDLSYSSGSESEKEKENEKGKQAGSVFNCL